jgi:hypothetical protein
VARSRTTYMKVSAVTARPELSGTLVRLMLAVNDIALAADASDQWAEAGDQRRIAKRNAARGYFVRVLLSHVYEGLKVVEEISISPRLRSSVEECDARTISTFQYLEAVVKSSDMDIFDAIRNRATFHYDRQLPIKSLEEIAKLDRDQLWSYSVGSEPLDWRFELADAVMDRIIVRQALGLKGPKNPERRAKTEELALRLQEISHKFTDFASDYVRHFCR